MIERLFVFESTRRRQREAPLLEEREQYLSYLLEVGVSKSRVCTCRLKHLLGGKMLEEVARKHHIKRVLWEGPRQAAILLEQLNVAMDLVSARRVENHTVLLRGLDVVDELSIAAAEIEKRVRRLDPA